MGDIFGNGKAVDPGADAPKMPSAMRTGVKGGLAKAGMKHGGLLVKSAARPADQSVMTIVVTGSKDSGKSCFPAGLKCTEGRKVVISCDDTTVETLQNRYGAEFFDGNVELYEVTRRQFDDEGNEVYPGFDPNRVETGEIVLGNVMLLLDQLEQDGDVECLFVDHFQALYEQVAPTYARHVAGLGPDDRMQLEHWGPRTQAMGLIEAKIRRVPSVGKRVAIISGYGAEEKTTYEEQMDEMGRKKRIVVRVMQEPKWLSENIRRNWLVALHTENVRTSSDEGNTDAYTVEVLRSKVSRFPKGQKANVTNADMNIFYDEGAFEGLDDVELEVSQQ